MDLVSIITPNYNESKFISFAIESVINQTYKNWELIIIDDVSTDNSVEIIKSFANQYDRIKLIQLNKSSGPAVARNVAIKEAKGRYIAFLDADDLWYPEKLEKQITFMKENNLVFTYSAYELIDEYDNSIGKFAPPSFITYENMLKTCSVGCLTAIYDTKKLGKLFMPLIDKEDYGLWLKILKKINSTKGLNEVLAKYRIRKKSVSSNKLKAAKYQWKIYRNVENLNLIKSIYYFLHYAYNGIKKY